MTLPPLLTQHVEELKSQDYDIEVSESSSEICIVFKNYPLPIGIWNRDKSDLLVITNAAYPNSKMDMFWVTPGLTLKDGRPPEAGNTQENHGGKDWQRFSWHPGPWDPARDNLVTYLEVVNHRLHQSK